MKGVREFWIEFGGDPSDDEEVYKRYSARVPFKPTDFSDEVVHCVEAEPVLAEMEYLCEMLDMIRSCLDLNEEGRKYIAKKALESHSAFMNGSGE